MCSSQHAALLFLLAPVQKKGRRLGEGADQGGEGGARHLVSVPVEEGGVG